MVGMKMEKPAMPGSVTPEDEYKGYGVSIYTAFKDIEQTVSPYFYHLNHAHHWFRYLPLFLTSGYWILSFHPLLSTIYLCDPQFRRMHVITVHDAPFCLLPFSSGMTRCLDTLHRIIHSVKLCNSRHRFQFHRHIDCLESRHGICLFLNNADTALFKQLAEIPCHGTRHNVHYHIALEGKQYNETTFSCFKRCSMVPFHRKGR